MSSTLSDNYSINDVRRVVRHLELAMESLQISDLSDLEAAMADYSRLVQYCNQRLLDAHDNLRDGNRSHAIELVEKDPNILDCLQELDTVDSKIPEWHDTLDLNNIRKPERVLSEFAEALSQQYDVKHQLAEELRAHRLLAIGNGPIEQRVAIMRRMLRLDPENKLWRQDLTDYERHCQTQLRDEIRRLDKGLASGVTPQAAARVAFIIKQLEDVSWQDPVDAAVIRDARQVAKKVRRLAARAELGRLAQTMRCCHDAADADRAPLLLAHWRRLVDTASLTDSDPLVTENDDLLRWHERCAERQASREELVEEVGRLSALISRPIPGRRGAAGELRDALRAAQQRVNAAAGQLDDNANAAQWIQAATARIKAVEQRMATSSLLVAVAASGAVAFVGVCGFLLWQASETRATRAALVARIESLRSVGRHLDVNGIVALAAAKLRDHAEIRESVERVDHEIDQSQKAAAEIQRSLDDAVERIAAASESVLAEAAYRSLDDAASTAARAAAADLVAIETALNGARKLLSDAHRSVFLHDDRFEEQITDLQAQADRQRSKHRRWVASLRDTERERLGKRLDSLAAVDGSSSISAPLANVEAEIKSLESFSGADDRALRARVAEVRDRAQETAVLDTVRRDLNRASSQGPEAVLVALELATGDMGDGKRGQQAREVAQSRPAVAAVLAWSEAARTWRKEIFGPKPALADWLAAIQSADKGAPPSDNAAGDTAKAKLDDLSQCLRQMTADEDTDEQDLKPLSDYLRSRIFGDDVMEADVDGQSVYFLMPIGNGRPRRFLDEDALDDGPNATAREVGEQIATGKTRKAAHEPLAVALKQIVRDIRKGTICFDQGLMSMIAVLLGQPAGGPRADELLRTRLLNDVINLAMSRHLLQENKPLERLQEQLASKVGEGMAWVLRRDPVKKRAIDPEARLAAENILEEGAENLQKIEAGFRARLENLGTPPSFCRRLEYAGWIDDSGQEPQVSGTPREMPSGAAVIPLFTVVVASDDEADWSLVDCGRLQNGIFKVRTIAPAMFGRPLFIERPAPPVK